MNQDRLLTIIQQLENDIARVEDAMQSAHLAIRRLMSDLKTGDELDAKAVQATRLTAGQFRARDGTAYEVKHDDRHK